MNHNRHVLCLFAALLAVAGCERKPGAPPDQPPGQPPQASAASSGWGNAASLAAISQRWQQSCAGLQAMDPVRSECPQLVAATVS